LQTLLWLSSFWILIASSILQILSNKGKWWHPFAISGMWLSSDALHEKPQAHRLASLIGDNVHPQPTTASFPWLTYPFGFPTVTLH
jgi:hypothetical protein